MSTLQKLATQASFAKDPLNPSPTEERPSSQRHRIFSLFESIRDGRHPRKEPWTEFRLGPGQYDEIERQLELDETLWGYVQDKIRYDYNADTRRLVIQTPSTLKAIRSGPGPEACFAQKMWLARLAEIEFPSDTQEGRKSKYEPDASFWHEDAQYPGVIVEVAYSQKKKRLARLAEDYLLDSDANVQAAVGLDIEYGKEGSREATLSVWRTRLFPVDEGSALRAVQEIACLMHHLEPYETGSPANNTGLRLRLSDLANKGLVQKVMGSQDRELAISAQQLCEFLGTAEARAKRWGSLGKDSLGVGVRKRRGSETPPEEIALEDGAKYIHDEERAAKRVAEADDHYENISTRISLE
ncbi:hypothetical protein EJ04DRAFT_536892 [Polyplosphaeria fusca]|uniref:Uncharacterized protein n=1 Tax=Polyplosphaeria fusca TaxID=682080 RepID=A0A9P4QU77_9PLEO|nr:hypothetical protein EJ04DRAFT_536892 [Polyplosphaeria fusca]